MRIRLIVLLHLCSFVVQRQNRWLSSPGHRWIRSGKGLFQSSRLNPYALSPHTVTNFIMKAFINGRKLFGTPFYPKHGMEAVGCTRHTRTHRFSLCHASKLVIILEASSLCLTPCSWVPSLLQDYFFDSKVLTDGELAPNDRCCRICGKIGHYMKDCPKRRRYVSLRLDAWNPRS